MHDGFPQGHINFAGRDALMVENTNRMHVTLAHGCRTTRGRASAPETMILCRTLWMR